MVYGESGFINSSLQAGEREGFYGAGGSGFSMPQGPRGNRSGAGQWGLQITTAGTTTNVRMDRKARWASCIGKSSLADTVHSAVPLLRRGVALLDLRQTINTQLRRGLNSFRRGLIHSNKQLR